MKTFDCSSLSYQG